LRLELTFPLRRPVGPKREANTEKEGKVSSVEQIEGRNEDKPTMSFSLSIES